MKDISDKKKQRLESKKKKIVALSQIMELNDKDHGKQIKEPECKKLKTEVPIDPVQLSDDQYKVLKDEIHKRRCHIKNVPKLRLKEVGEEALLNTTKPDDRIPLLLDDIQHLLMHTVLRTDSPYTPSRWCVMEKSQRLTHTVVLLIEGLTANDFTSNKNLFIESTKIFQNILEIIIPSSQIIEELACVPLTEMHKDILISEYGTLEAAMHHCRDHLLIKKSVFTNIQDTDDEEDARNLFDLPDGDKFPRTALLLSPIQMVDEDYPLPLSGNLKNRYKHYVMTKEIYKPVGTRSPLFGLDCEMIKTGAGDSEVARVSICDEKGNSVYETMVRPDNNIIDYLTQFSGITPEMMKNVTKTLKEVQIELQTYLPGDAILVGQSLNFDLHALKMMHPYVIDTAVLFNLSGSKESKTKLKVLAKKFLNMDIQSSKEGHSSIEDSIASLKLAKLKLTKDIYFGNLVLQERKNYHKKITKMGIADKCKDGNNQMVEKSEITTTIFSHTKKRLKTCSIIATENNETNFHKYFSNSLKSESRVELINFEKNPTQEDAVEKTRNSIINYDFNLSCIKLEKSQIDDVENVKETIKIADSWIRKIWESLSLHGNFVVILGGGDVNTSSSAGVAMIETKKN